MIGEECPFFSQDDDVVQGDFSGGPGRPIRLYSGLEDALAAGSGEPRIRGVTVYFDGLLHRLVDGCIVTVEAVPEALLLEADVLPEYARSYSVLGIPSL